MGLSALHGRIGMGHPALHGRMGMGHSALHGRIGMGHPALHGRIGMGHSALHGRIGMGHSALHGRMGMGHSALHGRTRFTLLITSNRGAILMATTVWLRPEYSWFHQNDTHSEVRQRGWRGGMSQPLLRALPDGLCDDIMCIRALTSPTDGFS